MNQVVAVAVLAVIVVRTTVVVARTTVVTVVLWTTSVWAVSLVLGSALWLAGSFMSSTSTSL
jgi:hypothetical protein